jgi:hypothetical protein
MERRRSVTTFVLIALVIILGLAVLYAFVLKPAIDGYAINAQNIGVEYAVSTIMQAASNCQVVPLNFNNKSISLVDVNCLQKG